MTGGRLQGSWDFLEVAATGAAHTHTHIYIYIYIYSYLHFHVLMYEFIKRHKKTQGIKSRIAASMITS